MVKISLVHHKDVETNPHDSNSCFHRREEEAEQDLLFDVDLDLTYFGPWMYLSFSTHTMFPLTISPNSHYQDSSFVNFWESPPAR